MKLRWFLLLSLCLGLAEVFLPSIVPRRPDGFERIAEVTASVSCGFLLVLVVTLIRHRGRGLWVLLLLPLAVYWPLGFALLDWGCAHNLGACP